MRRTLTGNFEDLDVDGEQTVNGAVTGARVGRGAGLTVNGSFAGDAVVEQGGILVVQGSLTPASIWNEGLLMLAGITSMPLSEFVDSRPSGRVAAAPGSIFGSQVLEADGSLRPVRPDGENINFDGVTWHAWVSDENRFVSLDELERGATSE